MGIGWGTPAARPAARLLLCGVLATAAAGALLTGCTDTSSEPGRPSPAAPASIPVTVEEPHAVGPFPVRLQVGLPVLTPDRCDPSVEGLVCSTDGRQSWKPVEGTAAATVTDVRTRLSHRHTSWTTVVAFEEGDGDRLRRWSRSASSVGGVVLVLDDRRQVLVAVPASTLRGTRAVLTRLDKPTAWSLVEGFSRG